jgi:hypothetical protein
MCCYVCVLYSFKSLDKETSVLWYTCIYKGDTDKIIIQQINSVFSHLIYIFIFPFSEQAADGSLLTIYLWYILYLFIFPSSEQAADGSLLTIYLWYILYLFIFPSSEQAADGGLLTIYLWYILWSDILHIRKNKEQAPSYCVDFKKQRDWNKDCCIVGYVFF